MRGVAGPRERGRLHAPALTGLKPVAAVSIDESKKLMDVLAFDAGGQHYGLPADEVEQVLRYGDALARVGDERINGAVDLEAMLTTGPLGSDGELRVIFGRNSELLALVRGRVTLRRVFRTQLLPIPLLIRDQAMDRGVVGIAVSEESALFLLVSLLPFGGVAVPL